MLLENVALNPVQKNIEVEELTRQRTEGTLPTTAYKEVRGVNVFCVLLYFSMYIYTHTHTLVFNKVIHLNSFWLLYISDYTDVSYAVTASI